MGRWARIIIEMVPHSVASMLVVLSMPTIRRAHGLHLVRSGQRKVAIIAKCMVNTGRNPGPTPTPEPTPAPAPTPVPVGQCSFRVGGTVDKNPVDYVDVKDKEECCARCAQQGECTHFTFVEKKSQCVMRSGVPEYNDAKNRMSGEISATLQV